MQCEIISFQNGEHLPHIILEYTHNDERIVADLFLNRQLLTENHFLRSQNANGLDIIQTFNRSNVDLCHYQVSADAAQQTINVIE